MYAHSKGLFLLLIQEGDEMADFTDSFYFTDEPDNSASKETASLIKGATAFTAYKAHKSAKELMKKHRQKQHAREVAEELKRAGDGSRAVGSTMSEAGNLAEHATSAIGTFFRNAGKTLVSLFKHPAVIGAFILGLLVILLAMLMISSFTLLMGGMTSSTATSYTAAEEDLKGVEEDYASLEEGLRTRLDSIETEYPGFDEYDVQMDEVNHDPYQLLSYLTATEEDFTRNDVLSNLEQLFDKQYSITMVEETVEEEDSNHESNDGSEENEGEGGTTTKRILHIKVKNKGLEKAIHEMNLTDDQKERYDILMETKGNRQDLFESNIYANSQEDYLDYDIPGEALSNQKFAQMIGEAEKYLGYPYVWGGSSPSTSFDCSGYISWVINHSGNGWNYGRQTANGLKNLCSIIPKAEAKPGDLIFFQGTYNTSGASHVGLYVGNNMMIHCGSPISYADITTPYWVQHFFCYGRLS